MQLPLESHSVPKGQGPCVPQEQTLPTHSSPEAQAGPFPHMHAPPSQMLLPEQESPAPHWHFPAPHRSAVRGSHPKHAPPSAPQASVVVATMHTPDWQQPGHPKQVPPSPVPPSGDQAPSATVTLTVSPRFTVTGLESPSAMGVPCTRPATWSVTVSPSSESLINSRIELPLARGVGDSGSGLRSRGKRGAPVGSDAPNWSWVG
jgi:hypothetical protein